MGYNSKEKLTKSNSHDESRTAQEGVDDSNLTILCVIQHKE